MPDNPTDRKALNISLDYGALDEHGFLRAALLDTPAPTKLGRKPPARSSSPVLKHGPGPPPREVRTAPDERTAREGGPRQERPSLPP